MTHGHDPFSNMVLQEFVSGMAGHKVLVIGDIMLDRFIEGEVLRISPESPVPVLSARRKTAMLGGAGNVVANLCGLGVQASLVAVTGADDDAATIGDLLAERQNVTATLLTATDRPSTVKTRFLASGQHLLRMDEEYATPISGTLEQELIAASLAALDNADVVILSDYAKGVLTSAVITTVIGAANARKIPVIVDPKVKDYSLYRGADIIKPNRKELAESSHMPVESDEQIVAASLHLIKIAGIGAVLATRAQQGMSVIKGDGTAPAHLQTTAREVFDVSGAGDTVIATLAAALSAGAGLEQAAIIANHAAGIVVGKSGTAAIRVEELEKALDTRTASIQAPEQKTPEQKAQAQKTQEQKALAQEVPEQAPLATWAAAAEQIRDWKAQGLKVGFTNGCFDILHAGHVKYLSMARARCDRLVVGINTDDSVRRLKGPTRPVNDALSRACVLGGLASVDLVVPFGEREAEGDTPLELIRALTPDLLVKGQDYTIDTVVGADYVISCGGEVWLAPLEEGKSTSITLKKIADTA